MLMMTNKKTKGSFCFICLADLEQLKFKKGRKRKDDLIRKQKDERAIKLLIKYLLHTNSRIYDKVLKDVLKLGGVNTDNWNGGRNNDGMKKLARLCEKCEVVGAKLLELHLELEKLQMRIINEVRSVRRRVLNRSGWLGGIRSESGLECFEQFSKRFCGGILSSNEQKTLFNTLKAFQNAVAEIDERSIHVPLVYLDKYKIANSHNASDSGLETIPDGPEIVKTEPHYADEAETLEDAHSVEDSLGFLPLVDDDDGTIGIEGHQNGAIKYDERSHVHNHDKMIKKEEAGEATSSVDVLKCSELFPTNTKKTDVINLRKRTSARRVAPTKSAIKSKRGTTPNVSQHRKTEVESKPKRQRVNKPYYCESCNFSFKYACSFEQNLREHEQEEKNFHCDKCNVGFSTQQHYRFHQERHKGLHKLKCDICSNCINPFDFPTHLKTHVKEAFPCPYCSYWCSSMDKKLSHINYYHFGVELTCDICGTLFQSKRL